MASLWALVEWIEENRVFPSYGLIKVDPLAYTEDELNPGRTLMIRLRHETNARRGHILVISENKQHVKANKKLMERNDRQMHHVMTMCMQTIQGMQPDPMYLGGGYGPVNRNLPHNLVNARSGTPQLPVAVVTADSDDNTSDTEDVMASRTINPYYNRAPSVLPPHFRRMDMMVNGHNSTMPIHHGDRPMMSSTPLPPPKNERPILMFDKATQTGPLFDVQHLETSLRKLYCQFLNFISQHPYSSSMDPRIMKRIEESANIAATRPIDDIIDDLRTPLEIDGPNTVNAATIDQTLNLSTTDANGDDNHSVSSDMGVRRVSAQTTNNIEQISRNDMVPIGSGHAVVPARLLNEIDWNSYTSATRQLLQAIFPRRTLATHSLTGKQSPAFQDKPPKKCLDPKLVDDIVNTVAQRCGVDKRLVRNIITIKCTDESKLYRNRQQYLRARSTGNHNDENVPPPGSSSDESSIAAS